MQTNSEEDFINHALDVYSKTMKEKNTNNLGLAMSYYICPICCKESEKVIIMNKTLTKAEKEKVEGLNNKCVGFSAKACDECAKYKDDAVFFIVIDESKSKKVNGNITSLEDFYRTGRYVGIRNDAPIIKEFEDSILTTSNGVKFCFIDVKAFELMQSRKD